MPSFTASLLSFGVTFVFELSFLWWFVLLNTTLQLFPTRVIMDFSILNAVSKTTTTHAVSKNSRTCRCSEVSMSSGGISHAIDNDFVNKSNAGCGVTLVVFDWLAILYYSSNYYSVSFLVFFIVSDEYKIKWF